MKSPKGGVYDSRGVKDFVDFDWLGIAPGDIIWIGLNSR